MKYIKTFENINNEPEVGDYVLCEDFSTAEFGKITLFTLNNVGIIIEKSEWSLTKAERSYVVEYEYTPSILEQFFNGNKRDMSSEEIIFYSKDRDVVEDYITARKYNL